MAKPQLEDGYIRLADEIARAFMKINFSPQENRILWAIIKETYGWRKKEKAISLGQLEELTGMAKPHVCHALKRLQDRRIIIRKGNSGKTSIQKDYEQWKGIRLPIAQTGNPESQGLPEQAMKLPEQAINVAQTGNRNLKSANKNKGNSSPTDITDSITDNIYGHPGQDDLNKRTIPYPKFKRIVIEYLNKVVEKNFPVTSKVTDKFLRTRYNEGRTVEECKLVIDNRTKRWLTDPERYQYLRPSTLFRPTNFENWITEARAEQAKEKANREAGARYEKSKKEIAEKTHRELAEQARKRREGK